MSRNKRKERIIEELLPGIRAQAWKRSREPMQAEDMAQDAIAAVLVAYKRYCGKSTDEDLVTILGAVARNAIIDAQRQSVSDGRAILVEDADTMDALAGAHRFPHHGHEIEAADLLVVIRSRLSDDAQRVLEERMEPSPKTERLVKAENRDRKKNRDRGFFTVRVTRITDAIVAKSLGLPRRRVQKASKEIRTVVVSALKGR